MLHRPVGLCLFALGVALAGCSHTPADALDASTRQAIDAGNQAWVDGIKRGDAQLLSSTYAPNAIDCGPTGDCVTGPDAVAARLAGRIAKLGRAVSASVTSDGATRQGVYIYEWGRAQASFANGAKIEGHYLTVWQRRPNGPGWLIIRNLAIPPHN
jgi:ketosteroid isomerase-like protein